MFAKKKSPKAPKTGSDTEFWVGWGVKDYIAREAREKYLAPHQKLANKWGASGSSGALTIHWYFLTNSSCRVLATQRN